MLDLLCWQPRPDMFLLAAEKEGVAPSECIVVEDSTSGIMAAEAASMDVVGYLGGGHAQSDWWCPTTLYGGMKRERDFAFSLQA